MKTQARTLSLALLTIAAVSSLTATAARASEAATTALSPAAPMATPSPYLLNAVRHELVMMPYYSVFDNIQFRVDGSTVTLMGQVTRPTLKADAARAISRIRGVEQVVNTIEVLPLSPMDDDIRRAVYRTLYSQRSPLFRYGLGVNPSIQILVKNGNVTLVGLVGSEFDRTIANIRANSVPGIFSVTNLLQVVKS